MILHIKLMLSSVCKKKSASKKIKLIGWVCPNKNVVPTLLTLKFACFQNRWKCIHMYVYFSYLSSLFLNKCISLAFTLSRFGLTHLLSLSHSPFPIWSLAHSLCYWYVFWHGIHLFCLDYSVSNKPMVNFPLTSCHGKVWDGTPSIRLMASLTITSLETRCGVTRWKLGSNMASWSCQKT